MADSDNTREITIVKQADNTNTRQMTRDAKGNVQWRAADGKYISVKQPPKRSVVDASD